MTSRLFDPLGWLAPTVVKAKISLQHLWLQGLGWDESLGEALTRRWLDYQAELPLLERIRVPRWIGQHTSTTQLEVHGFADASETAYAAVVYLRVERDTSWDTALLAAKTKVAPVKPVSLPCLELCAATLLVRLASRLQTTLNLSRAPLHLWSDSTVALGWIRGHLDGRPTWQIGCLKSRRPFRMPYGTTFPAVKIQQTAPPASVAGRAGRAQTLVAGSSLAQEGPHSLAGGRWYC